MAKVLTGISGNVISAASAAFAPTNSADVSAIASAYQVVSATATQLYAGTAYVTSVNDAPLSASRAGQAANASLANSAYYDGTGRLISSLPDSAAVSAIASSYAESAASGKQDELTFSYDDDKISAINGSALAGQGGGGGGSVASPYGTITVTDGTAIEATNSAIGTAEGFNVNNSGQANYASYSNSYEYLGSFSTFKARGIGLTYNSSNATRTAWISANTNLGDLASSFVLPASSVSAGGLLSTSNIDSIYDSRLKVDGGTLTLSGSYPVLFVTTGEPYSAVKELAWKDDIPESISLGFTPNNNYVSSLNNVPLSASFAGTASTVNTATYARYDLNSRPLTSFITKSDIPSIASPSGTIAVTDYDIEATNSAVVTGAFPGYGLQTASYTGYNAGPDGALTATLPLAHPNAELVVALGYGYAGTASAVFDGHTSTASAGNGYGPATATLKVPNATTARIYTDTYRSIEGISASALYGTGITGVAELAWASALPTYSYDAEDKISAINGSALGGMDEAAVSGIASAYAESAVSSVSGNYYTTANESGFLTAQAQASWSESASASPSYIQDKPDLVDIVAGPGIVVDNPDGNTLRVSMAQNYETLLWSGDVVSGNISLSEPRNNFSRLCFVTQDSTGYNQISYCDASSEYVSNTIVTHYPGSANSMIMKFSQMSATDPSSYNIFHFGRTVFTLGQVVDVTTSNNAPHYMRIYGINRTASAQ